MLFRVLLLYAGVSVWWCGGVLRLCAAALLCVREGTHSTHALTHVCLASVSKDRHGNVALSRVALIAQLRPVAQITTDHLIHENNFIRRRKPCVLLLLVLMRIDGQVWVCLTQGNGVGFGFLKESSTAYVSKLPLEGLSLCCSLYAASVCCICMLLHAAAVRCATVRCYCLLLSLWAGWKGLGYRCGDELGGTLFGDITAALHHGPIRANHLVRRAASHPLHALSVLRGANPRQEVPLSAVSGGVGDLSGLAQLSDPAV